MYISVCIYGRSRLDRFGTLGTSYIADPEKEFIGAVEGWSPAA